MPRSYSLLLALLATASTFATVQAQTASVSIPAWVEEGHCGPTPKFAATFNGKPAPVTSQLGPGSDQVVLVVLDFTGELSLVDAAKQALMAEISKLPANAWVGLLRDQDGLHVLADPGPNRQPLLDAIKDLATIGKPGLFETVSPGLALADSLMRKSPVRVSVLYITDSNIYNYREDYTNPVINGSDPHDLSRVFPDALIQDKISKLVGEASVLEAPLFVVHINYRRDTLNESYENGLLTLADATGGKGQVCRSVAEIPDAIAAAFTRIGNAWRLTLGVPPKFHSNAQIRLSAPCDGEDVRLSWRTHLRPKEG
ncbi:MAG TPA: hypothetical protein VKO18_19200 [Terriglobia bacterium]|nr:hypothetical protein [Terriglobia bacterium]